MAYSRAGFERGVAGGDEAQGEAGVFLAHIAVEVGHRRVFSFRVSGAPFGEEADRQAAKHAQDPDAVAVADSALIFAQGGVEALMESALDAPVRAAGPQPLRRVQLVCVEAAQQPDRLGFVSADVAVQLRRLRDVRKADLLRRGRAGVDLAAFPSSAVELVAPGHGRRHGPRGKKPPEWRQTSCAGFFECRLDCL